jgi:hypothetical protein
MAFEIYQTLAAGAGVAEEILGVASTQYAYGEALAVTAFTAVKAGATSKITHIAVNMFTPINTDRQDAPMLTTTAGEKLNCVKVAGGLVVLVSSLRIAGSTPTFNGTACNANSSTTGLVFTGAGSTNDFTNGTVYVPEIDDGMHFVVSDTVAGGDHTLVVVPPFRRPPTTGDTLRIVPFSKGATAVKLNASTPTLGISTVVADKTGGHAKIESVDLKNYLVFTTHPDLE